MQPELVIFVGLQASGKSTWYRTHMAATHVHLSNDLMPRSSEKAMQQSIADALTAGRSVAVDNTSATPKRRAALIALGQRHGARIVAIHFASTTRASVARNRGREGRERVPDVAIFATAKRLTPPTLEEGFHEVRFVDAFAEV